MAGTLLTILAAFQLASGGQALVGSATELVKQASFQTARFEEADDIVLELRTKSVFPMRSLINTAPGGGSSQSPVIIQAQQDGLGSNGGCPSGLVRHEKYGVCVTERKQAENPAPTPTPTAAPQHDARLRG